MTPEEEKAIVERMVRAMSDCHSGNITEARKIAQAAFDIVKGEIQKRDEAIKWYKGRLNIQHEAGRE